MAGRMYSERRPTGHSNWNSLKFSVSKEETLKNIITDFSLSEEDARNYMEKYW